MELTEYNSVIGQSTFGKSFFVKKELLKLKMGVLYLNWIGDKKDWKGYVKVNANTSKKEILKRLLLGQKLVYFMHEKTENKIKEIFAIYELIKDKNLVIVLDEVHIMAMQKKLRNWLIELATSGRHHFKHIIYITQSMSLIPNIIFTQSQRIYFFVQSLENQYYRGKGIDYEKEIGSKLKGKKYVYVKYDGINFSTLMK